MQSTMKSYTKHTPTRYKLSFKGKDKKDEASLMLYTQWNKKKRWHDFIWKTQCFRDNHVGNHTS